MFLNFSSFDVQNKERFIINNCKFESNLAKQGGAI